MSDGLALGKLALQGGATSPPSLSTVKASSTVKTLLFESPLDPLEATRFFFLSQEPRSLQLLTSGGV